MRKVQLEFPTCGIKVTATLLENHPKQAQEFWDFLEEPVKTFSHPTLSTGDLTVIFPRPPYEPPAHIGDQTNPLVEDSPYLCDVQAGEIIWLGWNIMLVYGPNCTEPLKSGGAYVAQVDDECLADLEVARKDLWYHTFLYHKVATVVFSRKEDQ